MGNKPTPGPWGVAVDSDSYTNIVAPNADGTLELVIAECWGPQDVQDANAALIVTAVNSHEKLVEALHTMIAHGERCNWFTSQDERDVVDPIRALLTSCKREGEK